jgi:hypothetical protein
LVLGLLKGEKEVQWTFARKIFLGWVLLPILAALISFYNFICFTKYF